VPLSEDEEVVVNSAAHADLLAHLSMGNQLTN
jgi:hypothetical protein